MYLLKPLMTALMSIKIIIISRGKTNQYKKKIKQIYRVSIQQILILILIIWLIMDNLYMRKVAWVIWKLACIISWAMDRKSRTIGSHSHLCVRNINQRIYLQILMLPFNSVTHLKPDLKLTSVGANPVVLLSLKKASKQWHHLKIIQ